MDATGIIRSRRIRLVAWSAFLLLLAGVHAVSATLLDPVVEERLADGCFEWCGLDRALHQISAGIAIVVLVTWVPILWASARTVRGTRITGHTQWILASAMLLAVVFLSTFLQPGHWSWFLNMGASLVAIALGIYAVWSPPASNPPTRRS